MISIAEMLGGILLFLSALVIGELLGETKTKEQVIKQLLANMPKDEGFPETVLTEECRENPEQ